MKKYYMKTLAIVAVVATSASSVSAEEDRSYYGVQYNSTSYDDTSLGVNLGFDAPAVVGRIGSFINDNFAFESRLGLGFSGDTLSANGTGDPILGNYSSSLSFEIDTLFGVYGLGSLPISNNASVYGAIGFTAIGATATAKINSSFLGSSSVIDSHSENDLSYGLGMVVQLSDRSSINLEYMSYLDKSDFEITSINLGLLVNY